jgi:MurNAc alpha-1-phosphate uridylyltransferase
MMLPPVAILAGGLATRLRPVTEQIPKALVEVAGEPFIFHQFRLLARNGVTRVVMCLGYRGEQVVEAVGAERFGIAVEYLFDGPVLLGTGGALVQALPHLGPSFFVLYGDSYLDCDYLGVAAAFARSGCPALMTVFRNEGKWDTSNVEYDGTRILAYSKTVRTPRMRYIDYGLGMFSRTVFEGRPSGVAFDLAGVYEVLAADGKLAAFEVTNRFYEVGSFDGIREFSDYLGRS